MKKKKSELQQEEIDAILAETARLKEELRLEKMRTKALNTMIDIAERMFNVPIRKKEDTKE